MRTHYAGGLAVAAVLSLAACGGGNSGSQPTLGLGEIRELTGLSAPVETAATQQARQQDIVSRADSLIVSTTCQSALKIDPLSACKTDPLGGTAEVVPVANRGDPRGFV